MKHLPPPVLVKAWLELLTYQIPYSVKSVRKRVIIHYFGSTELAWYYVEQNERNVQKVS